MLIPFLFQGVEYKFQGVEYIFQGLKYKFQGLKQNLFKAQKKIVPIRGNKKPASLAFTLTRL